MVLYDEIEDIQFVFIHYKRFNMEITTKFFTKNTIYQGNRALFSDITKYDQQYVKSYRKNQNTYALLHVLAYG